MIDLRSDTVTKPTPEMRHAMANAEVGDDVYQEDPTVNRLEERAAEVSGKEAAIFVPSGCMGNTIALKMHTVHGQEFICESRAHVLNYELAMAAWFTGCLARPLYADRGVLTWDIIKTGVKAFSPHNSPTALVEIENTHNVAGGTVYTKANIDDICDNAHALKLKVHMDGARVFNASAACGLPVKQIVEKVDSVMFCLSKGLGAPVGSMLAGARDAIDQARLYRKRLGGGMRQAGVLAAAGLIALESSPAKLPLDHENAKRIGAALAELPGVTVTQPETNIVFFDVAGTGRTAAEVVDAFKAEGVLMIAMGPTAIRAVTHFDVSRADCDKAMDIVGRVLGKPVFAISAN
ncbi:MAG: low specificity L-threonine aldolase [Bryobacterales bacterium]|nr:low specificity L-threonine aldolase [Bryobacterales bacterium]